MIGSLLLGNLPVSVPAQQETMPKTSPSIEPVPQQHRDSVVHALQQAGKNRDELLTVFARLPEEQRTGAAFLIANMPDRDLTALSADFLVENIQEAYRAWKDAPWGKDIPEQIFLSYILPYANFNERRDNWRADFHKRFHESAWKFKTATEAVTWFMTHLNDDLNCHYHATKRPKPDQSPSESIEAHYASCTGLSILFADACRSVGIPARIVGLPTWKDKSGNHNWVEVWDGNWQNVGDTSGDPRGPYWVNDRCPKQCDPDNWQHSIFAACWRKTPLHFPLVWNDRITYIPALNITRFYTQPQKVEILIPGGGEGTVEVHWGGELIARKTGKEKVTLPLAGGCSYEVIIQTTDGKTHHQTLQR